jgi:hypothetical protein
MSYAYATQNGQSEEIDVLILGHGVCDWTQSRRGAGTVVVTLSRLVILSLSLYYIPPCASYYIIIYIYYIISMSSLCMQ